MMTGFAGKDKEIFEQAGKVVFLTISVNKVITLTKMIWKISNEAIGSIRTVAILNKEKYFIENYGRKIEKPYK